MRISISRDQRIIAEKEVVHDVDENHGEEKEMTPTAKDTLNRRCRRIKAACTTLDRRRRKTTEKDKKELCKGM